MSDVPSLSIDAIYSSHNIEHLYPHEVMPALKEFYRVLRDDGFVVLTCPDLQTVCEAVVNDKLLGPLYVEAAGPISPIDILYGHREYMAKGNLFMAHRCGFTASALDSVFLEAGFVARALMRRPEAFDLWIVAFKKNLGENESRNIALKYIP